MFFACLIALHNIFNRDNKYQMNHNKLLPASVVKSLEVGEISAVPTEKLPEDATEPLEDAAVPTLKSDAQPAVDFDGFSVEIATGATVGVAVGVSLVSGPLSASANVAFWAYPTSSNGCRSTCVRIKYKKYFSGDPAQMATTT